MKHSVIGLLLVLCLLLSACGAATPDAAQTQPTETTETTVPTPEPEAVTKYPEAHGVTPVGEDYYQYGNMQKGSFGEFILYGDEILFNTVRNGFVFSYDMETGKVRMFCIKEGCAHDGSDCVYVESSGGIEQYGGKLYHKKYNPNTLNSVQILENGKWNDVVKDVIEHWYYDGDLYTVTRVGRKLQVYEDGVGEPKTITENYTLAESFMMDGYLYGSKFLNPYMPDDQLVRVDPKAETYSEEVVLKNAYYMIDEDHIYYVSHTSSEGFDEMSFPGFFYRSDLDGSNKESLLTNGWVYPASLNFDDEYIYYRTGYEMNGPMYTHNIYRMSKADPTKREMIATLPESVYQIFTVPGQNLLFATGAPYYEGNNHTQNIYVMNADGSNLRQLELP